MPYVSEKQRRYMHAQHPKIARKWDKEEKVKKNLKPFTPIFKSDDPDFNHEAAQKIYDLVMKMDADSAEMFARIVMGEVLEETIEKNLTTLQKHLNKVVSKRIEIMKKATLRAAANDSAGAVEFAKAFTEISKLTPYDYGYRFREQDFNRDPETGMFKTKIKHTSDRPLDSRTATQMGIHPNEEKYKKKHGKRMTAAQKARYQQEYAQLASFLSTVTQSTKTPGDTRVVLQWEDANGNRFDTVHNGTRPPKDELMDPGTRLIGAVARPETLTAGGAAFGLVPSLSAHTVGGINRVDRQMGTFSDTWTRETDPRNSNARLYNRVKAGSQLLEGVGGPKTQTAVALANFVGSHGPEAEKVIGPTARKTAYRYRGTEKTPDKAMISAYGRAVNQAKSRNAAEAQAGRQGRSGGRQQATHQMAAQRIMAERRDPTMDEIRAGSEVIANHLRSKMPDPNLYKLQLASGNTPPSEGVMLNDKGQIITQAIGYGDDHYLPFNLKNLKGLKGGEYIRTRSVGGPTSEDIYTGLVAGARRITVISRSGTFTVTFEDDFRGGRRHNDKARRMTRRYEQILDAVQSEQVDRQAVPPEVRQLITDEVFAETEGWGIPRAEQNKMVRDRIEEYKSSPDLTEWDEKLLEAQIKSVTAGAANEREAAKLKAQLIGNKMAQKEFKFRLNGPGYEAALKSLEEQFPYYIKTDSKPQHDLESFSGNVDLGYVEPGRNRPTAASAGLFTAKNKAQFAGVQGKFSAAEADYQGYRGKAAAATAAAAAGKPANGEEAEEKPSEAQEHSRKAEEVKRAIRLNRAASQMQKTMNDLVAAGLYVDLTDDQQKTLAAPTSELVKPQNLGVLNQLVNTYVDKGGRLDPDTLREFRDAAGHLNRVEFDRDALMWADEPNLFKGRPYKTEATFEERANEMMKRDAFSVRSEKRFSQMDEEEMAEEFEVLTKLHAEYAAGGPVDGTMKANAGAAKGAPGLQGLTKDTDVVNRMENLQRVRALKADMSDEDKEKMSGQMAAGPLVVHRPLLDEKEVAELEPQKAVDKLRDQIADAAHLYEGSDSPEDEQIGGQLQLTLDNLEKERVNVRTSDDVLRLSSQILGDDVVRNALNEAARRGPTGTKRLPE